MKPRVAKKAVDKLKRWPDGASLDGIQRGEKTKDKEDRALLKNGKTPDN